MKGQVLLRAAAAAAFLSLALPLSRTATAQTPQFQPGDFNVHTSVHLNASGYQPFQRDQDFLKPAEDTYIFAPVAPNNSGQPDSNGMVMANVNSGRITSIASPEVRAKGGIASSPTRRKPGMRSPTISSR